MLQLATLIALALGAPRETGDLVVERLEWTSAQKIALVADLHIAAVDAPTVLCIADFMRPRSELSDLASVLAARGLNSLTLDLRGHGESSPDWSRILKSRQPRHFQEVWTDIQSAVDQLGVRGLDISRLALVTMGSNFGQGITMLQNEPGTFRAAAFLAPTVDWTSSDAISRLAQCAPVPAFLCFTNLRMDWKRSFQAYLKANGVTPVVVEASPEVRPFELLEAHPEVQTQLVEFLALQLREHCSVHVSGAGRANSLQSPQAIGVPVWLAGRRRKVVMAANEDELYLGLPDPGENESLRVRLNLHEQELFLLRSEGAWVVPEGVPSREVSVLGGKVLQLSFARSEWFNARTESSIAMEWKRVTGEVDESILWPTSGGPFELVIAR